MLSRSAYFLLCQILSALALSLFRCIIVELAMFGGFARIVALASAEGTDLLLRSNKVPLNTALRACQTLSVVHSK